MFNLARDLERRAHGVVVVTGYEAARQFDGPPVRYLDTSGSRDEAGAMLADLIAMLQPSLVLTHHYWAHRYEPELAAAARAGIPVVQVVLNGHRIPEAALAVYISEYVRRTSGDSRPDDLTIHPMAFPADVVAPTHGRAIGFMKPIPHKGIELLYRIARTMATRRFVVLRGEWQDLEVIRHMRNVTFMEPVVDIREFYSQCRMLLVPSQSEDAGTVAQEATANGLPCLSSDIGGLVETNAGGILLPADDPRPWLRAIRQLDDPALYAAVVASQREAVEARDPAGALDALAGRVSELVNRKREEPSTPA